MLSLRGIYFTGRQGRDADTTLHLSDVKFEGITSTVLGNLGATLTTTLSISVPPHSPRSSDMEPSPAGSSDTLEGEGAYAWEWCDEQVEYSDDPFRAGLTQPEKPPALVPVVQEEKIEMAEVEKDGSEIQVRVCVRRSLFSQLIANLHAQEETRLGDLSPV